MNSPPGSPATYVRGQYTPLSDWRPATSHQALGHSVLVTPVAPRPRYGGVPTSSQAMPAAALSFSHADARSAILAARTAQGSRTRPTRRPRWAAPADGSWAKFLQAAAPGGEHIAADVVNAAGLLKAALLVAGRAEHARLAHEHGERHAGRLLGAGIVYVWASITNLLCSAVDSVCAPLPGLPRRGLPAMEAALEAAAVSGHHDIWAELEAAKAMASYVGDLWLAGHTHIVDVAAVVAAGLTPPPLAEGAQPKTQACCTCCARLLGLTNALLVTCGGHLFRALPAGTRLLWFVQGSGLRSLHKGGPAPQQGAAQLGTLALLGRFADTLMAQLALPEGGWREPDTAALAAADQALAALFDGSAEALPAAPVPVTSPSPTRRGSRLSRHREASQRPPPSPHADDTPPRPRSLPGTGMMLRWSDACRWCVRPEAPAHCFAAPLVAEQVDVQDALHCLLHAEDAPGPMAILAGELASPALLHPGLPPQATSLGWRLLTSMVSVNLKLHCTSPLRTAFQLWSARIKGRRATVAAGRVLLQTTRVRELPDFLRRWRSLAAAHRHDRRRRLRGAFGRWVSRAASQQEERQALHLASAAFQVRALTKVIGRWRAAAVCSRRKRVAVAAAAALHASHLCRRCLAEWRGAATRAAEQRRRAEHALVAMDAWRARRGVRAWVAASQQAAATRLLMSGAPYFAVSMAVRSWAWRVQQRRRLRHLASLATEAGATVVLRSHLTAWREYLHSLHMTEMAVSFHAMQVQRKAWFGLRQFAAVGRVQRYAATVIVSRLSRWALRQAWTHWADAAREATLTEQADDFRAFALARKGLRAWSGAAARRRTLLRTEAECRARLHARRQASALQQWHATATASRNWTVAGDFAALYCLRRAWSGLHLNMLAARRRVAARATAKRHAQLLCLRHTFAAWRAFHRTAVTRRFAGELADAHAQVHAVGRAWRGWKALAVAGSRRRAAAEAAALSRIITWTAAAFDAWAGRTAQVAAFRAGAVRRNARRLLGRWAAVSAEGALARNAAAVAEGAHRFMCLRKAWRAWQSAHNQAEAEQSLCQAMDAWHARRLALRAFRGWAAQTRRARRQAAAVPPAPTRRHSHQAAKPRSRPSRLPRAVSRRHASPRPANPPSEAHEGAPYDSLDEGEAPPRAHSSGVFGATRHVREPAATRRRVRRRSDSPAHADHAYGATRPTPETGHFPKRFVERPVLATSTQLLGHVGDRGTPPRPDSLPHPVPDPEELPTPRPRSPVDSLAGDIATIDAMIAAHHEELALEEAMLQRQRQQRPPVASTPPHPAHQSSPRAEALRLMAEHLGPPTQPAAGPKVKAGSTLVRRTHPVEGSMDSSALGFSMDVSGLSRSTLVEDGMDGGMMEGFELPE